MYRIIKNNFVFWNHIKTEMDNNIILQQEFFLALSRYEPDFNPGWPSYNGYKMDEMPLFKSKIQELYINFEKELTVNLQSEFGELFLKNALKKLQDIYYTLHKIHPFELTNSFYDSDLYSDHNILHQFREFLDIQLDFTNKAFIDVVNNLELLPGNVPSTSKPVTNNTEIALQETQTKKYTSDLSLINLTVFWAVAAECKIINLKSRKQLIDFISNNYRFKKGNKYVDINPDNLKALMSKLYNTDYEGEASMARAQEIITKSMDDILEDFKNGTLKEFGTPGINNENSRLLSK
jgi:hypothetical protein